MTNKNFIFVLNRVVRMLFIECLIILMWVGMQYMRYEIVDINIIDILISTALSWYISKDVIKIERKIQYYDDTKRTKQF